MVQAQRAAVAGRYRRGLVRGGVYAVDGTGLGADHPAVVAWRSLKGAAAEQGKEAAVTRTLIEQTLAAGGPGGIRLLLADGRSADGPLLAWLKYAQGINALVRLPADRLLYADLQGLVAGGRLPWQEHRYTRTVRGSKERRTVALPGVGHLDSWPRFVAAAACGVPDAHLWACLIRVRAPTARPPAEAEALVRTRDWPQPWAAFQAYRGRWAIEDDTFRELKEGWGLECQSWGAQHQTVHGWVTLTLLAFLTAQLYRTRGGQRLADKGIRRLRQLRLREPGPAPTAVYLDGRYWVFPREVVFALLGAPVRASLLLPAASGST